MSPDAVCQVEFVEHAGQPAALTLRGDVGIYSATALYEAVVRLIAAEGDVHVQCESLAQLDTASLQLLLLLAREIRLQRRRLHLLGTRTTIGDWLALVGAVELLACCHPVAS